MTRLKILAAGAFCALSAHAAPEQGAPFAVTGEQLVHRIPAGWKLAWMEGTADGAYMAEYIPEKEEITSWREGYLMIRRIAYPSAELLAQLAKAKADIADVGLMQTNSAAAKGCAGKHQVMPSHAYNSHSVHFAAGGGFCDLYGPAAPLGEGSYLAFAEGRDFLFQIQYGWRPRTQDEHDSNLPWRISAEASLSYLNAIKDTTLCGGTSEPACR